MERATFRNGETHQQCFEYVHARNRTHDIPTCHIHYVQIYYSIVLAGAAVTRQILNLCAEI
jgi:hypothetical protein